MRSRILFGIAAAFLSRVAAQTYSTCNPLYSTGCPLNPALGKAINVDFKKGAVDSFMASGNPTYDSNGVHFTVAKPGDSPQLISIFYIMFGKVSLTMKAAPGAGIVSSLVLQSDTLDEIDMEWLGADDSEVQTNYFGKGDITTYNRGAFNPAPNNQARFITYTIEWTEKQITWSVGNTVVRVLTPGTADANQYPQSPMQVKFGSWSGGDSSNPAGTISWARGPTNYGAGPYTMTATSLSVIDYSTGTQYKYGDTSGSWGSIQAIGGKVNGNSGGAAAPVATADRPSITSASPSIPAGFGGRNSKSETVRRTGWPWVASATPTTLATVAYTSVAGVPSGWIISSSGKIVPASSAAASPASTPSSSAVPSPLSSSPPLVVAGLETVTSWDDRGFATTKTVIAGWHTLGKSFDQQGFLITATATSFPHTPSSSLDAGVSAGEATGFSVGAKVAATSSSTAAGATHALVIRNLVCLGMGVALVEKMLY